MVISRYCPQIVGTGKPTIENIEVKGTSFRSHRHVVPEPASKQWHIGKNAALVVPNSTKRASKTSLAGVAGKRPVTHCDSLRINDSASA
jgi:hypothetical protein